LNRTLADLHAMHRLFIATTLVTLLVTSGAVLAQSSLAVQPESKSSKYHLVWSDDFEGDGPPDPANWNYEHGFMRNQELQWYQPENARCKNGLLVIEARRERIENSRYDVASGDWRRNRQHADYSSASMNSRRKHEWTYGRMEMRGRIDTRKGMWPAFWTVGSARSWPGCGEIDIMEFYSNTLLANVAWLGENGKPHWNDLKRSINQLPGPNWADKFHVWRLDWDCMSITSSKRKSPSKRL
jgi:beta-glucanase (GH16 family)